MATVRLNETLKEEILDAGWMLFDKRMAAVQDAPECDKRELALKIRDIVLAETGLGEAFNNLPAVWRRTCSRIYLRKVNGVSFNTWIYFDEIDVPPTWQDQLEVFHEDLAEMAGAHAAWKEAHAAVEQERKAHRRTLLKFLDRHTTLKQALGEWPQLWELVPQWAKDEHNRKASKVPLNSAGEPEPFDTSDLTGALVVAKIVASTL